MPMKSKKLEANAMDLNALPSAINPRLGNLIAENEQLLSKIMNKSKKEIQTIAKTYKDPELRQMFQALINRGILTHEELLSTFRNNMGTAFQIGLAQTAGTPAPVMSIIQETVVNSVMNYVTRLDSTLKADLSTILANGYTNKIPRAELIKQMTDKVGISEYRARMIARTETMRSSNIANWSQAKAGGARYFVVDHRAAACKYCIKQFSHKAFKIDQTEYIPPFHPNCACVPVFFHERGDAVDYLDRVNMRNLEQRNLLKKQGHKIPDDGTGVNALGREQRRIWQKVNKNSSVSKQDVGGVRGYSMKKIKQENLESYISDRMDYYSSKLKDEVYVRGANFDKFDEKRFLNSKSYDEFIIEEPTSKSEAQDLIDKYDLPGKPFKLPKDQRMNDEGWGVKYDGVNALDEYDENLMGHSDHVIIFKGKSQGDNLLGDGDVVIPTKILEVIKVQK